MATKIMQDPKLQPQASISDTPLTVYEMTLSRRGLTEIKGLEKYKKLRVLDASCNKLTDTQGIQFNHVRVMTAASLRMSDVYLYLTFN